MKAVVEHLVDTVDIWHIPPVCAGQVVVIAYGIAEDGIPVRRITDRSDGSVSYQRAAEYVRSDWQPWNTEPNGYNWVE